MLDLKHSVDWNREALYPFVADDSRRASSLVEGALMRLMCGVRCSEAYRSKIWPKV